MNHDDWLMTGLPDYDEGIEADEDDMDAAIQELSENLDCLREALENSTWIDEYASYLFTHCEKFRDEVLADNKDWLNERAQEICDSRHSSDPSDSLP
jgi:hypothetical protein